jgi:hypothetical protein
MVFNICIANVDDHLRNHGFLRTNTGWTLSPAYDLNPVPSDVRPRILTTNVTLDEWERGRSWRGAPERARVHAPACAARFSFQTRCYSTLFQISCSRPERGRFPGRRSRSNTRCQHREDKYRRTLRACLHSNGRRRATGSRSPARQDLVHRVRSRGARPRPRAPYWDLRSPSAHLRHRLPPTPNRRPPPGTASVHRNRSPTTEVQRSPSRVPYPNVSKS